MARGWESKDIESRQEQLSDQPRRDRPGRSPEQAEYERQRELLRLSRLRVATDLAATIHPRRREQLEAALAHLDQQLTSLDPSASQE
jgi:hypothetical protein